MKKWTLFLLSAICILVLATPGWGQRRESGTIAAAAANCTAVGGARVVLPLMATDAGAMVVLSGTWVGTVNWLGTADGVNYVALNGDPFPTGAAVSTATANGTWRLGVSGMTEVCVRASAYTSGVISVLIRSTPAFSGKSSFTTTPSFLTMTEGEPLTVDASGVLTSSAAWKDATVFAGANEGAQVVAAYAALPAAGGTVDARGLAGGTISQDMWAAATKPLVLLLGCGTYTITVAQVVTAYSQVIGSGDCTILSYTTATGTAFTFNYPLTNHKQGAGLYNLQLVGPSDAGTAIGLLLGGTSGAEGFRSENVRIADFGTCLQYANNTWATSFAAFMIRDCETLLNVPTGLTNTGENLSFSNGTFAGATTFGGDVTLNLSIAVIYFTGVSFDNAQLVMSTGVVSGVLLHFENPSQNITLPFVSNTGANFGCTECDFLQGQAAGAVPTEFINQTSGYTMVNSPNIYSEQTMTNFLTKTGGNAEVRGIRVKTNVTNTISANAVLWTGVGSGIVNGQLALQRATSGFSILDQSTGGLFTITNSSGLFSVDDDNSLGLGTITPTTGTVTFALPGLFTAGTTLVASFNMPSGVAKTDPAPGDFWNDGTNLLFQDDADVSQTIANLTDVVQFPSASVPRLLSWDGTTLALATATSGGIPWFGASGVVGSSAALTANLPVIGGGAGATPTVGTRSGNTTAYVTTTGTQTSGDCVSIDASGNHIADGAACGGGGGIGNWGGSINDVVALSSTEYASGDLVWNPTEANRSFFMAGACTLKNFYFSTSTPQSADGSLVVTLRDDGANTAVTITVAAAAGAGTFSDLVNTAAVAAGSLVAMQAVNAGTTNSAKIMAWGFQCN